MQENAFENVCKMLAILSRPQCVKYIPLTHKQLQMPRCMLSTVATNALVLKHQAISIHSPD